MNSFGLQLKNKVKDFNKEFKSRVSGKGVWRPRLKFKF